MVRLVGCEPFAPSLALPRCAGEGAIPPPATAGSGGRLGGGHKPPGKRLLQDGLAQSRSPRQGLLDGLVEVVDGREVFLEFRDHLLLLLPRNKRKWKV